ncbi:T9SS type A sorting domain-containing protein [Carboxylicivirga mesophila]|uniref:T9SS type A sorting domain-containing protein n=1 Tax=Carboxylicivirga mesophila TaxID=1166478 RepID=A0ABS5KEZ0_9BACT|nr:T9SS type A sorting domain-containing protein [Carboxylicivirga mesophila]MBS2213615.1 T9SS type A sorting domain-containing protein [Carboxylicivirga mesophila]
MRNIYTIQQGLSSLAWLGLLFCLPLLAFGQMHHGHEAWKLVTANAEWAPRAGLQVVRLQNNLYVLGGRTPLQSNIPGDSEIWGDVWKSNLSGKHWTRILATDDSQHWPARAYFCAITKGNYMYVIGGQNFNPFGPSAFFNDVWRSKDGINWEEMTSDAPWTGRAGISAFVFRDEIYVLGGSRNDDDAVIGGPPVRIYYNDVWKSKNGSNWQLVTADAPWTARAGMRVVVKNGYMYLMGGESGFTPSMPGTPPPYYNDVWRSRDGANWEQLVEHAPWSARPGHEVLLYRDHLVLFGGFNLDPAFNPIPGPNFSAEPNNPMDIWASRDGVKWFQLPGTPWNAEEPMDVKYDFHAIVVPASRNNKAPAIMTVGGDRETFNFTDPLNYLNVDNDVWRFYPDLSVRQHMHQELAKMLKLFIRAYPNPFVHNCTLQYNLPEEGHVGIQVYDVAGNMILQLVDKHHAKGLHEYVWNGVDNSGKAVRKGMYFVKLTYQDKTEASIIMKK